MRCCRLKETEINKARGKEQDCYSMLNKHSSENKCDLKPKTAKTKVKDVMDTLQHVISIIKKETVKNPRILAERNRHTKHENATVALIMMKTSMSRAFSEQ